MIRKIMLVCALGIASLCAQAQLNTNRMMSIGRNALYFEDYVLSIQYFNRVINMKPYLAEPYYFRAIAKFYLDDFSGSYNDCSIALNINPFLINAYNLRGIIDLRRGKSTDALADFTTGLRYEPDNVNLLMNCGIANINLKEYDEAIANYDKLLRYDRRNVSAILYRGIAFVEKGDTATAMKEFERATEINKYSADAYMYRAMLNFQTKQLDEALENYNHLTTLRPMDANVRINRAIVKYNMDDLRGCLDDLDYALRLDSKNLLAYANRGMIRAEVGALDDAISDFSRVLAINPADDIALFNRVLLYMELKRYADALHDLNIIVAKHPDFAPAYYQRSAVKRSLGDTKGAELDYMTAYTFENDRVKRGLQKATDDDDTAAASAGTKKKKAARSKNDNDIRKYNQMVVVADFGDNDDKLKQEKEVIRGRVQDRDIAIDLEPFFELNFHAPDSMLMRPRYFSRSVEAFNNRLAYGKPLAITNREYNADGDHSLQYFNQINDLSKRIELEPNNMQLYVVRGTLYNLVMNYNSAINDFSVCILKNPVDVISYFNRAATRFKVAEMVRSMDSESVPAEMVLGSHVAPQRLETSVLDYDMVMNDLKRVVELEPDFEFAYYNMSIVQCIRKQYAEALQSLNTAIELNADFAEAYFNRGILNIYMGNDDQGRADLSKAGELGIYKAYNVIKRYTNNQNDGE